MTSDIPAFTAGQSSIKSLGLWETNIRFNFGTRSRTENESVLSTDLTALPFGLEVERRLGILLNTIENGRNVKGDGLIYS